VRVLRGSIFDVAVDLRCGSPTYGKWCSQQLTADQGNQLFIPRGFAHGFCTLEDDTEVAYKTDDYYEPECDAGIVWDDPLIAINWPVTAADVVLSTKDAKLPRLADFTNPFVYAKRYE
jgi:dTDP-4-dehydrorhamnose 3,5-epimerase